MLETSWPARLLSQPDFDNQSLLLKMLGLDAYESSDEDVQEEAEPNEPISKVNEVVVALPMITIATDRANINQSLWRELMQTRALLKMTRHDQKSEE